MTDHDRRYDYIDSDCPLGPRGQHDPDVPTGWAVVYLILGIGVVVSTILVWRFAS